MAIVWLLLCLLQASPAGTTVELMTGDWIVINGSIKEASPVLNCRSDINPHTIITVKGDIRRVLRRIRRITGRGAHLLVWLILKDHVQPSFIAGV